MTALGMPTDHAALKAALAGVLLALTGCDSAVGPGVPRSPSAPSPSSVSVEPFAPEEKVFRLPAHLDGPVGRLDDVPTEFPASLAEVPDVRFGLQATGVQLSYRPREALDDGSGWSSETVALWLRDNRWAKLSLGSLGLPAGLWPGADMMGAGELNDGGDRLAFHASGGVVVIDLASGTFRHYAGDVGPVGAIRWHPGGSRFTADPWGRGPDVVVDVSSGSVSSAPVPASGLGFLKTGKAVSITRRKDRDVVVGHGRAGDVAEVAEVASLVASPLMTGRKFMSWFSGSSVAYYNREAVRGRYALRVADVPTGQPVATLTWSSRTGMFFSMHGWWDRNRILLSIDRSLATWAPETGEIVRVASLPRSDIRQAHASVGISFPESVG